VGERAQLKIKARQSEDWSKTCSNSTMLLTEHEVRWKLGEKGPDSNEY
jgi:hypothetical protein